MPAGAQTRARVGAYTYLKEALKNHGFGKAQKKPGAQADTARARRADGLQHFGTG